METLIIPPGTLFTNFKVAQHGRTCRKIKAVTFALTERHKTKRHAPAMQGPADIDSGK